MAGILVPISFFLVTGAVLLTWIFFRSKERQLMLERGLTPEQIFEFYKSKKSSTLWLKWGIVIVFFGIGLALGFIFDNEDYLASSIVIFSGIGFVLAYFLGRKFDPED